MSNLLTLAEGYVGTPYIDGEFDCADLAARVQWELFGRAITLPQHRRRPQGGRGQAALIQRLRGEVARRVDQPATGQGVILLSDPANRGGEPLWHIGTVFVKDGETWVLHNSHALGSAALHRLDTLRAWGLRVEGFYEWAEAASPRPDDFPDAGEMAPLAQPAVPDTTLVITPHPVLLDGQRTQQGLLLPGETLAAFLARHGVLPGQQWRVAIGGAEAPEAMWAHIRPKHGQVIEAGRVLERDTLRIVAILAIAVFAPQVAGAIAGAAGLTGTALTVGTSLISAALTTAGAMVVNKLLPPSVAKQSTQKAAENTYSLSGGRNRARPFEPMALVLGEPYCVPDLAGQPYTYFSGGELFLWQTFHAGINCGAISALRIGQTAVDSYQDVTLSRAGFLEGNTGLPELAASVDTVAGALLDAATAPGAWTVRTSSAGAISLAVDLEASLTSLNSRGEYQQITCAIGAEYRAVGGSTWLPFVDGSATTTLANTGTKPVRVTLQRQVQPGQYEVRLRKESPDASITTDSNTVQWVALKTYQADTGDYAGQARLGLQIRANGQLNGAVDELNWQATARPMPCWNGSQWVTATNRATGLCNPGAQFLLLARGIHDENGRLIAGLGLPDEEIEIEQLKLFMLRCAAKGFEFDLFLQENLSIDELLDAICAAGMAARSEHTGKLGVIWFAEDQVVEHVQNMGSMKLKSFSVDYETLTTADEIEFQYFDRERGNTWQSIRVLAPWVTTPTTTARQQLRGVSTEAHAAVLARFSMAQNVFQRKTVNFSTDLEHLNFRRGTLMAISHDLTQWGHGGRLRAASRGPGGVVTLTLDELVPSVVPVAGTGRYIALRLPGETGYRLFGVQAFSGSSRTVTLTTPWPAGVPLPGEDADNPAMDTLWIYDFKASPGQRMRVAEVAPEGNLAGARAALVPEGPEFWAYVWTGAYTPPPNNSLLVQDLPVVGNLRITVQRLRQGDTWVIELTVTFDVAGNLGSLQLWAAPVGNALERIGGDIRGTRASMVVQAGQAYAIEVRPFDTIGRAGTPAATTHTVAANPPAGVQGLAVAVQPHVGVVASWAAPAGLDAVTWAATELRTGASHAAGVRRFQGKAASSNLGWLVAGTTTVWASHVDTAGEASAPVSASITIQAPIAPTVTANQASVGAVEIRFSDCTASQPLRRVLCRVGTTSQQWADAADAGAAGADQRSLTLVFPNAGTRRVFLRGEDLAGNLGDIAAADLVIDPRGALLSLLDNALSRSQLANDLRTQIDLIEPIRLDTSALQVRTQALELDTSSLQVVTQALQVDTSALQASTGFQGAEIERINLTRLAPLEADNRDFERDVRLLAEAVTNLALKSYDTDTVVRDAGIVQDPATGQVRIFGVEQAQKTLSEVQVALDAQQAAINLRATRTYVDNQIAAAALDPSALPVFTDLQARITTAEVDIDGLNAQVALKASTLTVDSQGARLTAAETTIDALEGQIVDKVSTTELGAIDARLTSAESSLIANGDQASAVRSLMAASYALDAAAALDASNSLAAILAAWESGQYARTGIALAREQLTAKINEDLSVEALARLELAAKLGDAEARMQDEQRVRANADEALSSAVNILQVEMVGNTAAIVSEKTARATADEALAATLTGVQATVGQNSAAITAEQTARATADSALASQISTVQALANNNAAQIATEQTARANADSAIAASVTTLTARVGTAEAAITTEQTTRAAADSALSASLSTLGARVGTAEAAITTEQTARADADSALSSSVSTLGARVGDTEAGLSAEQTVRATADTALTNSLNAAISRIGTAEAAIITEQTTRASADQALSTSVAGLATRLGDAEADIVSEQTARSTADAALASSVNSLGARIGDAEAAIVTEQNTRSSADSALASSVTNLGARVVDAESRITLAEAGLTSEQTARATADSALAGSLNTAVARIADAESAIVAEQSARAARDEALTTSVNGISARLDTAESAIVSEQTARSTADQALTSSVNSLGTRMGAAEAAIVTEQNARSSADSALVSSVTSLGARVTSAETKISTAEAGLAAEQSARATADTALTNSLNTAVARVADVESAIVAEQNTRSAQDTALAQTITNLAARVTGAEAGLTSEQTARVNADNALTQAVNTLSSNVAGNQSAVNASLDALSNQQSTQAGALLQVQSRLNTRPNLCPNGGFERGLQGMGGQFGGWYVVDDAVWGRVAFVASRVGTFEMHWPPFAVSPGANYTVSGESALVGSTAGFVRLDLLWYNAAGDLIGVGGGAPVAGDHQFDTPGKDRAAHASTLMVPAGAVTGRVRFVSDGVTSANAAALIMGVRRVKVEFGPLPATPYSAEAADIAWAATVTQDIITRASQIDGLRAQYTLKTQVRTSDGRTAIAGIGLASSATGSVAQSEIMLLADKLTMVLGSDPDGPAQTLFTTGTVNGTAALILRAAWIGDLSVDTLKIAGNAITEVFVEQAAAVTVTHVKFTPDDFNRNTLIVSRTWTPSVSGQVLVSVTGQLDYAKASPGEEVAFYSSIQRTDEPFDGFARTNNYLRLAPTASSFSNDISKTRRLQVTAGVPVTIGFYASKFEASDTVTCRNVEMRIEHLKR